MRIKILASATTAAIVLLAVQLPTTVGAAADVPTSCLSLSAPQGPQGDPGPQGPQGDPGPQGPTNGTVGNMGGPARAPHMLIVDTPECSTIDDICVVLIPGEKGAIGPIGEVGPQGPEGPPPAMGPARSVHSVRGVNPCTGVPLACQLELIGAIGPVGEQGPVGEPGPEGPQGEAPILTGPSRAMHPSINRVIWVSVPIPADCQTYLASLGAVVPGGPALPATGANTGLIAAFAAALTALGVGALALRRRTAI